MRMRAVFWLAAGCAGAAPCLALAQERPPMQPTRDVTVTYRVEGEGGREMKILYSAGSHRMRVEGLDQNRHGFAIMDRAARRMVMVLPGQRRYMEMPLRGGAAPAMMEDNPSLRFARAGTETVAGLTCTRWNVTDASDPSHRGTACLTADGVLLHGEGGGPRPGGVRAEKVEYGALPAALFSPPADYQKMELPGMPPR